MKQKLSLSIALLVTSFVCASCGHDFWGSPISSISITPPSPSLKVGDQQQFLAKATYENGTTKVLSSPAWSTSNVVLVHITDQGLATALGEGSATITASSEGISTSTTVSIVNSPLSTLEIAPRNASVSKTKVTQQFSATGFFNDGSNRDLSSLVGWTSSDTSVATVSKTGIATLLKAGTTTITATSGAISDTTTLIVTD